jgi:hypothetical protein
MFARRTAEVNKLIPQLYLHGLAPGDFDPALRGLLGEEAPVSAGTVARLEEGWQKERGLNCPRLVGDGNLGIWVALSNVYPDANERSRPRFFSGKRNSLDALVGLPKKPEAVMVLRSRRGKPCGRGGSHVEPNKIQALLKLS